MKPYCYFNGKIIKLKDAKIPVNDIAILRGYGMFDFVRTFNGRPWQLKEHVARFNRSARLLGLNKKITAKEIAKIIDRLLTKNHLEEAYIRFVLTGGASRDGFDYHQPNFAIILQEATDLLEQFYEQGAKLITTDYERPLPEIKSSNYTLTVFLEERRRREGAVEVLYINQDKILEAGTSNFFIVKSKTLITAKRGILPGITRGIVLRLAPKLGLKIDEREVLVSELKTAGEAFITSTTKKILPIVTVDRQKIGNGKVGKQTKKIVQAFGKLVADN